MTECFRSYEVFEERFQGDELLLTQYKILFRRWDLLEGWQITEADLKEKVRKPVFEAGEIGWQETGLTLKDLLQWNYGYFRRKINRSHGLALEEKREVGYYTDTVEEMGESILQAFFCGEQPMLNVVYYPFQERPSRKIEEWGYHLVFDEVGTGKTVSALYCIRNVVARKKEDARVLIICPGNKKGEWEKDIQRQLGLYAHKVSGAEDKIYSGDWKSLFFKAGEPAIFIEGQKAAEMKESLNTWKIGNERWDLIIIDEGHLCFDNYKNLRGAGDQGLLLTATPIVVNISLNSGIDDIRNVRKVKDYGQVLWEIVAGSGKWKKGEIPDTLFDPNDYVTQLFREDLNIKPKKRNIRFIKCKRLKDRDRYLDILKSVKGGLTQLVYEQDDEFLLYGIYDKFKDDIERNNYLLEEERPKTDKGKYEELVTFLERNPRRSYIIFFNSRYPADRTYKKLIEDKNLGKTGLVIAKKFGRRNCEIWPGQYKGSPDELFDHLFSKIEKGERVLLITTGATGGTGLNLGRFDGVIHYELPFTSIELEQRFGRVDRMDHNDSEEKEMVFLLNEDANPMLRYAPTKIDETCKFMPIRNTILFYPEYINTCIGSMEQELETCKFIEEESVWEKVWPEREKVKGKSERSNKFIKKLEEYIINGQKFDALELDGLETEEVGAVRGYQEFLVEEGRQEILASLYNKQVKLLRLKREITHWGNLLGKDFNDEMEMDELESNSVMVTEDGEESGDYEGYIATKNGVRGEKTYTKGKTGKIPEKAFEFNLNYLKETYEGLNQALGKMKEVPDLVESTGLFYVRDGGYVRQSVQEYRRQRNEE